MKLIRNYFARRRHRIETAALERVCVTVLVERRQPHEIFMSANMAQLEVLARLKGGDLTTGAGEHVGVRRRYEVVPGVSVVFDFFSK